MRAESVGFLAIEVSGFLFALSRFLGRKISQLIRTNCGIPGD